MNPKNLILILSIFSSIIITNCESETKIGDLNPIEKNDGATPVVKDSIYYKNVNIAIYNVDFVSLDIDDNKAPDFNFEIINLNDYNSNPLPESFDTLAARVDPILNEILDNSTFSYPTALNFNDTISSKGFWSNKQGVLGTFQNAGQFQGQGEKYLGFRKYINEKYYYGWIKIDCSQHSDTLKILESGYNLTSDKSIRAGQID